MSSVPGAETRIVQVFRPSAGPETPAVQTIVDTLGLEPHIEGGFFRETDRDARMVASPFGLRRSNTDELVPQRPGYVEGMRSASTTIHYLLTPNGPQGGFHRNSARTMHLHHKGRGRYVIIHADEPGDKKRVETFVVGGDIARGERLQWIVEGGKYKASFLLPDTADNDAKGISRSREGLLISEVVTPGFEFCDHDFLDERTLRNLVRAEQFDELQWLLRPPSS